MNSPDVMSQSGTVNTMQPSSGSYGSVKSTEQLRSDLDVPAAPPGPSPMPTPGATPGMPGGSMIPPEDGAVPSILMAPTQRPDVPVSTPLLNPTQTAPMAPSAAQARLSRLTELIQNPNVSEETQEWARIVLERLSGGNK